MPVDSTKAMPSSTSRSDVRGRPVRPCTAGGRGRISGSTSAHSSSLISRDGGEDTDDDMPPQPPPTLTRSRTDTPIRTRRHLQRLLSQQSRPDQHPRRSGLWLTTLPTPLGQGRGKVRIGALSCGDPDRCPLPASAGCSAAPTCGGGVFLLPRSKRPRGSAADETTALGAVPQPLHSDIRPGQELG